MLDDTHIRARRGPGKKTDTLGLEPVCGELRGVLQIVILLKNGG